jgi:hypothetical protein
MSSISRLRRPLTHRGKVKRQELTLTDGMVGGRECAGAGEAEGKNLGTRDAELPAPAST